MVQAGEGERERKKEKEGLVQSVGLPGTNSHSTTKHRQRVVVLHDTSKR